MKQFLYKILLIDDANLKRARLYAWINVFLGSFLIVGAIVAFYFRKLYIGGINEALQKTALLLNKQIHNNEINYNDLQTTSEIILKSVDIINTLLIPIFTLPMFIGALIIVHGILYFRIHELTNFDT